MTNETLNVLHVGCSYFPYMGGGTHRLLEISRRLCNKGNIILGLITHTTSEVNTEGAVVEKDEVFKSIYRIGLVNSLKGVFDFYKVIRKECPDVIVLHNSRVALIYYILVSPLIKKKPKSIIEIHSVRESGATQKAVNKWLYSKADHIVVLADAARKFMQFNYGMKGNNIAIVRNGHDENSLYIKKERKFYNPKEATYAYIGSFHEWQGVIHLCKAIVKIEKNFWTKNSIYFVGDGPCLDECRKIIEGHGYTGLNIHFMGWLPKGEIVDILSRTDFLIAPRPSTVATETVVPLKVTESIESGIPLLCSTVGGLTELLYEDALAVFYESNNIDELVRAIANPLSRQSYIDMVARLYKARKTMPSWQDAADAYWRVISD